MGLAFTRAAANDRRMVIDMSFTLDQPIPLADTPGIESLRSPFR